MLINLISQREKSIELFVNGQVCNNHKWIKAHKSEEFLLNFSTDTDISKDLGSFSQRFYANVNDEIYKDWDRYVYEISNNGKLNITLLEKMNSKALRRIYNVSANAISYYEIQKSTFSTKKMRAKLVFEMEEHSADSDIIIAHIADNDPPFLVETKSPINIIFNGRYEGSFSNQKKLLFKNDFH